MNLKTENRKQSNDSPFGKGGRGGIWRKLKPVSPLLLLFFAAFVLTDLIPTAALANPTLVKDINTTTTTTNSSSPQYITAVGNVLYFTASTHDNGTALWKSDGTEAATMMVKDQVAATNLTNVNGTLFFAAGTALWKSDGTAAGTVMVKNVNYASSPAHLTNVNGTLFFVGLTDSGYELWKSDGTEAGTVMVKDINSGAGHAWVSNLTNVNGTLYFTAEDGVNGQELWKSDGTASGTVMVKDIYSGASNSNPSYLTNVNGTLYFRAADANGYELWKTDGTAAGTVMVKDIYSGASGSSPAYLTNVNGLLYFRADDGVNGIELWKSDGTASGTVMVKDINSVAYANSSPAYLTNVNGTLYFTATVGANGRELWKSDGTASGTVMVKDIYSGASSSTPFNLLNMNGLLYFQADDGANGIELWKSDGTASGTVMVKDINSGASSSTSSSTLLMLTNMNGTLYLTADDGVNGYELWRSDGTSSGTVMVKDLYTNAGSSPISFPLTKVDGTIYFWADDGVHGIEPWKSDGTEAGTVMVKDINSGAGSYLGQEPFTNVNGIVYFAADDGMNGPDLWKSDGTASGTVMVKDGYPMWLTNVNGTLYFGAADANGYELWKTDGTAAGTVMVKDIYSGASGSSPAYLTNVNGLLYFRADDGVNGIELWKSDGTASGTVMVKDIYSGAGSSYQISFGNPTSVNGTLYFTADDGVNGAELWKSDGTAAGTMMVKDIYSGGMGSYPSYLTNVNGTLYFIADDGVNGAELWKSDGTAAGTVMVKDIHSGYNSNIFGLTNVNGTLYFRADDGVNGQELWKSDGTASGTVMVKDIYSGFYSSNPGNLTNVNGTLYFFADDGVNGYELWKSDGTASGTVMVADIFAGAGGSSVGPITEANGKLFFIAYEETHGKELWVEVPDSNAPTATASPAGGTYTSTQSVTLTCSDGTGSGCDKIYYTIDGSTPTTSSSEYSAPISISSTATLKFFAKDLAGNSESVKTETYTITLDTPPSKPANIDVSQNGVKGELLVSWSNPSDADFNHIHIYRSTASGTLGTLIADNVAGIKYTDTGLASLTTYYYTVRAVDNAGNESTNTNADKNEYGYYPKAKTLDATPPAVPTGVTATDATTGGKINLSWTNPTDSDFSMIKIYRSTESGTLGSAVFIGVATSYSNTGLTNGVAYYYTVRAIDTSSNETTNTTQVSATPTAPDATPPTVPTTGGTAVVNTQAGGTLTISWTNPADSDFAFVRIYRSTTSGVLGNLVYDNVTGTSVTDTGLTNNATYYYTIRSVDTAGNESTNTNQVSGMPTDIQVPKNVTGLTTTLLSDGKIRLDWTRSSSTDVNAYNIYYDNGTGTIDYTYANKIGTVQHPTTTWTSGNLAVGPAYKFAVRAEDSAQNEETNTSVVASAVPVTNPNAGDVRGYIKVPQTGQKISGNRVTVVTDLLTGASIDVKDMRFQYKPASSGSWTDITPADPAFPNPDTTHPWFTHWDVSSLATGDYLIRAIATNVNLSTDATPAYITVTVDNTAPEASEGKNAENEPEKRQDVSANAANKTAIATESGVTELAIPEGALSTDTKATVTVEAPATKDSLVPSGYGKANEFRDITLDSGQTSLSNNKEAEIVIPYKDDNNDNIIDGTTTKVYDTKVMRYNETTLKWEKLDSIVDTTNKVVKGKTNHFTLFGLLAPPNPTTPGWNLVSVPLNPSPNSASSVFGQTPYVYNPTTNSYTRPSTITPGIGYWINGGANLTATGTETPTTGNFSITLKKGWNMIGNPFRFKVKVSDMKVNYNSTEYTMTQAETNGIVVGTLYPYVNGVYQFVNASDGGAVEPWVGYWILSDKDCMLLVPPTPAQ